MMNAYSVAALFKLLLKHLFTEVDSAFALNDWYNFVS